MERKGCPRSREMVNEKGALPTVSFDSGQYAMIPLVAERTAELAELCRRHHVKRLDVFGSAAVGDFNPEHSDIDFLVDFGDAPRKPWYGNHIDFKEDLETLFDRKVDLVDDTAIRNPYFRKSVDETREPIYAA